MRAHDRGQAGPAEELEPVLVVPRARRAFDAQEGGKVARERELARRLREAGSRVTSNSLCPGLVATDLGRYLVDGAPMWQKPIFALMVPLTRTRAKTIPQGASCALHLALSDEVQGVTGEYFVDSAVAESTSLAADMDAAAILWDATERLIAERCPA